jgi:hypothetical protein
LTVKALCRRFRRRNADRFVLIREIRGTYFLVLRLTVEKLRTISKTLLHVLGFHLFIAVGYLEQICVNGAG